MEKTVENLNTENKFLVDWFSFTSKIYSELSIVDFLGLDGVKFQLTYGLQGYRSRLYYDGINIHFNSERNEGVWVEMSGQGCRNFETFSKISFDDLFCCILDNEDEFHVTRLDVAYDDFKGVIPLRKLAKQILKQQFVTKFDPIKGVNAVIYPCWKDVTCNIGSNKSAVRFRVYDKAFERGYFEEIEQNHFSWTRWEVQLRDERALNFMKSLDNGNVGEVFKGVLLNYFRVVDPCKTDSNKRRWKTSKWFLKFIGDAEKIKLFTPCKTDYNLSNCEHYVYCQAGNAVDTLIKIKGIDSFVEELSLNKPETTLKYKELYNEYQQHTAENSGNGILEYLEEHEGDGSVEKA